MPLMRHSTKYTVSYLITEEMDHLKHRCCILILSKQQLFSPST